MLRKESTEIYEQGVLFSSSRTSVKFSQINGVMELNAGRISFMFFHYYQESNANTGKLKFEFS